MSSTQPEFLSSLFAEDGDTITLPDSPQGDGRASWSQGWTSVNASPLRSGGVPPYREDFNSIFYRLSEFAVFAQQGGMFTWDATQDYAVNAIVVGSDNILYRCVAENGASINIIDDPTSGMGSWEYLIPAATTSEAGIVRLSTFISSSSTSTAATSSAVKTAYDLANSKWTSVAATETVSGIVERATDAEASAGVNTTCYVTPYQLKLYGGAAAEAYRKSRIGTAHNVASESTTSLPDGYMFADGSLVYFADYPELYEVYLAGRLRTRSSANTSYPMDWVKYGTTGLYLPKINGLFARGWGSSSAGTAWYQNAAGVPNITGRFVAPQSGTPTGPFSMATTNVAQCERGDQYYFRYITMDLSASNSIYGNSDTVMPLSYNQPIAIYLGQPA